MKILLINPNRTASMTAKIDTRAQAVANPGTEIKTIHPAEGTLSVEGHYDEAIAAPNLLEEIKKGAT